MEKERKIFLYSGFKQSVHRKQAEDLEPSGSSQVEYALYSVGHASR